MILDRFGLPLGLENIGFSFVVKAFRENSIFKKQYRFKSCLEPNLAPKTSQNDLSKRSKNGQQTQQKQ